MLTQLRSTKLYARARRHEAVGQFVRYATIGVLNVVLYFGLFNVGLYLEMPVLGANAVAFFVTSVNSFILNKTWAFRDRRRDAILRQYFVFIFFTLIGLALNSIALTLFLIPLDRYGTLGKNAAAFCALPFSIAWNFASYRLWTFKPKADAPADLQGSAAS